RADLAPSEDLRGQVRVVFEADQSPGAGANIYWFDAERLANPHIEQDLELLGMGKAFFERNGQHFVSDSAGIARVPQVSGRLQVIAMTPTHFGMTTIEKRVESVEPIDVVLRPALGVDVLVRSASTREPVGSVVVVARCSPTYASRIGAITGKRGVARLWPLFRAPDENARWYASLPGVFRESQRVAIAVEENPATLELSLPDSAPTLVRLVDAGGELCPLSGKLAIGWNDTDGDPAEPIEISISEGIADLARVELGLTLHVRAQLAGTSEEPTAVFTTDARSMERARFDLVLQRPIQLLRARLVDQGGAPLALARASCIVRFPRGDNAARDDLTCTTRTNGEAVFQFSEQSPASGPIAFALDVATARGRRLGGVFHASLLEKSIDLGELRLSPPQRLFAGRVLDARGSVVGGATLRCSQPDGQADGGPLQTLECTSDAEGRFELLGWAETGSCELWAQANGIDARVRATLGDFAVEFRAE
ncbi:MAG: hypothetical protein ABI054_04530, partial [Planctomycetota bacterium]